MSATKATKDKEITAENLRAIRRRQGIRQRQIAEWIGGTTVTVSKIETGKRKLTAAEQTILNWHLLGIAPF